MKQQKEGQRRINSAVKPWMSKRNEWEFAWEQKSWSWQKRMNELETKNKRIHKLSLFIHEWSLWSSELCSLGCLFALKWWIAMKLVESMLKRKNQLCCVGDSIRVDVNGVGLREFMKNWEEKRNSIVVNNSEC